MSLLKLIKTTSDKVSTIPVEDGQLIFTTDRKETFLDSVSTRIELGDVIYIDSEVDRLMISTPIEYKLYYIKDSGKLYSYSSDIWKLLNVSSFIALSDSPDSYIGNGGKILKVKTDETGLEFASPSNVVSTIPLIDGLTPTIGKLLALTANGYVLADSTDITKLKDIVLCIESKSESCSVLEFGYYSTSGLTAGGEIYVGESGDITQVAPTTGYLKCIGYAISSTIMKFKPDSYSKQL
jgi:hypothetical protein